MVKEGEWLFGVVRLNPECNFAEFNGEWVFVHAVDAVGDDIADGAAGVLGGGFVVGGSDASELAPESSRSGKKKMPRTAGGIADFNREERLLLLLTVFRVLEAFADDGVKGGGDEFGDEFVGCVVGACGFSCGSCGGFKSEERRGLGGIKARLIVKEAFVDGAEFLNIKGGVVDAPQCAALVCVVDYMPHRLKQVAVAYEAFVKVGAPKELSVEDGKAEDGSEGFSAELREWGVVVEEFPEEAEGEAEVIVFGVSGAAVNETAEAGDAVVLAVESLAAEKSTVFGNKKEQDSVDDAEKMVVEIVGGDGVGVGWGKGDAFSQ